MAVLFWLLWVFNFLLLLIVILGKGFRESFGAGVDLNVLVIFGTVIVLIASLVLRFTTKQNTMSLVIVALPALAVLIAYSIDKIIGEAQ